MSDPIGRKDAVATRVAIACQGGGSHAAYVAGVLKPLLREFSSRSAADGPLQLVALSGTSGGAICALLAWWGLLAGGPKRAVERLEFFWERNSAQQIGEVLWDGAAVAALNLQPCEMQWSPYAPPMRQAVAACTEVWPKISACFGGYMRPDFFQLDESIASVLEINPKVDFESTADAIGKLCSMPNDVQRWQTMAFEEAVTTDPLNRPATGQAAERFAEIMRRIDGAMRQLQDAVKHFGKDGWLADAIGHFDAKAASQYKALEEKMPSSYVEGARLLEQLEDLLQPVLRRIPRLILGAVEVDSGKFQAFRSDREANRGGISLAAVMASAAIPYLFKAVNAYGEDGKMHRYWDGLFSQNPPVKTFTSPPGKTRYARESKPDEIWIAQVNPRQSGVTEEDLRTKGDNFDIFDRRNELAGNLSLVQETEFIDTINQWIGDSKPSENDPYQRIQVLSIPLDDDAARAKAGRSLGFSSKLCRDRGFKQALMDHGVDQAEAFLPIREFVAECFNQQTAEVRAVYAKDHPHLQALANAVDGLHAAFPQDFHAFIQDVALGEPDAGERRRQLGGSERRYATLNWRASAVRRDGGGREYSVAIKGVAYLAIVDGRLISGALDKIHVEDAQVKKPPHGGGATKSNEGSVADDAADGTETSSAPDDLMTMK